MGNLLSAHLYRKPPTGIELVSPGIKTGWFLFDSCKNFDILASKLLLNRLKFNSLLEFLKAVDFLFLFILEIVSLITSEPSSVKFF